MTDDEKFERRLTPKEFRRMVRKNKQKEKEYLNQQKKKAKRLRRLSRKGKTMQDASWKKRTVKERRLAMKIERKEKRKAREIRHREKREETKIRIQQFKKRLTGFSEKDPEMKFLRSEIRKERWRLFKVNFIKFINNPLKIRKRTKEEKFVKNEIRSEIAEDKKLRKKKLLTNMKLIVQDPENRKNYLYIIINSTVVYILSFLLIHFLYQLITYLVAGVAFNIPLRLNYAEVDFLISDFSPLWKRTNLVLIFSSGPIISIFIALILSRIFFIDQPDLNIFKTLILWGILHGFNMFFGAYISGVITREGFIYTSEWIFLNDVVNSKEIIFIGISLFALVLIGFNATKAFLFSAPNENMIRSDIRIFYVVCKAFLPWLFGSLIIYLLFIPNNPAYLFFQLVIFGILLIPVLINFNAPNNEDVKPFVSNTEAGISIGFVVFLVIVGLLLRIGLNTGI